MTFTKNRTYWLEHPSHGTFKALCCIVSANQSSLGFMLDDPVALQSAASFGIAKFLPMINQEGVVWDVISGDAWTVYEEEPATKIPTK